MKARERADVVVALREDRSGRLFVGEPWEQHADLRRRLGLGARTDGWLTAGFIDRDTGEFLTRGQAARRFPEEAGRTNGLGTADSADFECIRKERLDWLRRRTGAGAPPAPWRLTRHGSEEAP